jgi:hypothetical protein
VSVADEDWIDLGAAYEQAFAALERAPQWAEGAQDPTSPPATTGDGNEP